MIYEFENYQTKEREIVEVKGELIIDASNLISNIWGSLGLQLDEFIFANYFLNKGYRIYRLPLAKWAPFFRYQQGFFESDLGLDIACCLGAGTPDFLIINQKNKDFFFVEVKKDDEGKQKNGSTSLHKSQLKWVKENKNNKLLIGRLKPTDYLMKKNSLSLNKKTNKGEASN